MIKLYLVGFAAPDVCCTTTAGEASRYTSRDEAQLDCNILNSAGVRIIKMDVEYVCRTFQVEVNQEAYVVFCEGRTRAESVSPTHP